MKSIFFFTLLLLGVLTSCTQPPDYPIEPVLEFTSLSRNTMIQGSGPQDSLIVNFSYTDGDGDLGNNSDSLDVFFTDTRLANGVPLTYKLPFVPLQGTGNGISGEISIQIPTSCCTVPDNPQINLCDNPIPDMFPRDTLVYEIYIKDRAGNESNRILTDDIILSCI